MADGEAEKIVSAIQALMAPVKAMMIDGLTMSMGLAPHFGACAKAYYDAYTKVGFTPEQALDLTKHALTNAVNTVNSVVPKAGVK